MSLLTIVQGACRAARVPPPNTVIGNTSETALLCLQLANDTGESLARSKPGGWASMVTEFTFSTAATTTTGNVAGSSAIITGIPSTAALAANTWQLVSSAGFPTNSFIKSIDSATQVTLSYPTATTTTQTGVALVFGQSDYALPTDFQRPVDGTFWDRTRFWQMRGALSPQQWQGYKSSVLGTSATIQRRYRIRNVGGTTYLSIDPVPTDNNSHLVFEYVSNGWCQNASSGVRQTQWLMDSDIGVLDEYLIRKGVQWRLLDRLGMESDGERQEYEMEISNARAHDAGTQVLQMVSTASPQLIGPWNVPDTGFGQS